uniref:Uncharacterized protein n=1 Tax=Strigamia maritima TaxID=126957 RepID=T1IRQ4_STRMM
MWDLNYMLAMDGDALIMTYTVARRNFVHDNGSALASRPKGPARDGTAGTAHPTTPSSMWGHGSRGFITNRLELRMCHVISSCHLASILCEGGRI